MPTDAEIEAQARKMWDKREQEFPPHVRQRWEDGSDMARRLLLMEARRVLESGPQWDQAGSIRVPTRAIPTRAEPSPIPTSHPSA